MGQNQEGRVLTTPQEKIQRGNNTQDGHQGSSQLSCEMVAITQKASVLT